MGHHSIQRSSHLSIIWGDKNGRMMDSNFLAQELHKYILEDHSYKIKYLQNLIKERFQHEILYYKIWDAKQKAIANVHGN